MQWKDFEHNGCTYGLKHLDPRTIEFERPAEQGKPAVVFTVDVMSSLHCFSRELSPGMYDRDLTYSKVLTFRTARSLLLASLCGSYSSCTTR